MRKVALGLMALTFASSAALAQTPITFAQVDIDGDGRLTLAELQAVWPDMTEADFAAVDVEGLGSITPAQLDTLQPSTLGASGSTGAALDAGSGEMGLTSDDSDDDSDNGSDDDDEVDDTSMSPDPSLMESDDD